MSESSFERQKLIGRYTSTDAYRSCAALFDISNPLRYLIKSSLVWLVLVWFGLVDFILGLHGFGLIWFG